MFHPEQLLPTLQRMPKVGRYWLALSGGLDSTVLLHALTQLHIPFTAIHVDHGLSPESKHWSAHCRAQCAALGVEFIEQQIEVSRQGRGLEAAAREARYAVFEKVLREGEVLLTAHHQDDQVETLLLQLLRGGGVRGLAAMPAFRPLGAGWLGRPLLDYSRETLQQYAEAQGLAWIEDPSNSDTSLQRNYLRHELIPQLEQRQQGMKAVLSRSVTHFAEAAALLDEMADQDLDGVNAEGNTLTVASLLTLSEPRQRNLLRHWLRVLGLTIPDSRNLQRILDEVLPAAEDAEPLVHWQGTEVRRYRDRLYAMPPLNQIPEGLSPISWKGGRLTLPEGLGLLKPSPLNGDGIKAEFLEGQVTIAWRRGGERMTLRGRVGRHELKKLYQEAGIPPWERQRRPLIYIDGVLAQVTGLWTEQRFICAENESGVRFEWGYAIENAGENNDN